MRYKCKAEQKLDPSDMHFFIRYFACFTPASANPFEAWLYGDDVSCLMSMSARNALNSAPSNCRPPSVLTVLERPNVHKTSFNLSMTAWAVRLLSALVQRNPLNLSTTTRKSFP